MNRLNFFLRAKASGIVLSSGFFLGVLGTASAAEVFSPVVGFLKFDCLAESDTIVSAPFHQTPRWAGRAAAVPTSPSPGVVRISLKDNPSFATGELKNAPHFLYCRDTTGAHRGRHFLIVEHGANTVDVSAALSDLGSLAIDGLVSIIPAWTLNTLFPPASQTTLHASTGSLASQRVSELLFFDTTTVGTSLAPTRRFFVTNAAWFEVGSYSAAGNTVIEPGQAFIIRHPAGVAATTFVPNQQVQGGLASVAMGATRDGLDRDIMIALPRPVPMTLDQLDFAPGQFVESTSTAAGDRKDQLLVFDNTQALRNRQPSAIYFRTGGQWVRDTAGYPASGSQMIEPSAGLIVRREGDAGTSPLVWVNAPTYDVTAP
ncbi:MAG: TIGR02597 family protein [Verrucomicrobiales bacterium]|nr:TIGR02597 family protein [Verrucomicrobiales bacterium]